LLSTYAPVDIFVIELPSPANFVADNNPVLGLYNNEDVLFTAPVT